MIKKIIPVGLLLVICSFGCAEKPIPCPEAKATTPELSAKKTAARELTPTECAQRVISERDTALRDLEKSNDQREASDKTVTGYKTAAEKVGFTSTIDAISYEVTLTPNTVANADTAAAPAPTIEAGKVENTTQPAAPASKAN